MLEWRWSRHCPMLSTRSCKHCKGFWLFSHGFVNDNGSVNSNHVLPFLANEGCKYTTVRPADIDHTVWTFVSKEPPVIILPVAYFSKTLVLLTYFLRFEPSLMPFLYNRLLLPSKSSNQRKKGQNRGSSESFHLWSIVTGSLNINNHINVVVAIHSTCSGFSDLIQHHIDK